MLWSPSYILYICIHTHYNHAFVKQKLKYVGTNANSTKPTDVAINKMTTYGACMYVTPAKGYEGYEEGRNDMGL